MSEPDASRRIDPGPAGESPERFDPDVDSGTLVHAEHAARYLWAAQVAAGRTVLDAGCGSGFGSEILADGTPEHLVALDIAQEAVTRTTARLGDRATVTRADARDLPFSDASFDLIVCFELIEQISEGHRALAEFARVLRSDGLLLISSPNPRRYLPGNPHHVHEYLPEELREALGHHFPHVSLSGQQAWLGSLIADDDGRAAMVATPSPVVSQLLARRDDEDEPTYVLAAAGHGSAHLPPARMVLGDPFEVTWWNDRVAAVRAEALQAAADAKREADEARDRIADGARQQACLLARAHDAEQQLHSVEQRLLDLEQDYARLLAVQGLQEMHLERALHEVEGLRNGDREVEDLRSRSERALREVEEVRSRAERAESALHDLQHTFGWRVATYLSRAKQAARRARQQGT